MRRFEGQIAVVTGGAGGIGEAASVRLADEGARVFILDVDGSKAESVSARIGATGIHCDVADETELATAFDRVAAKAGRIDILMAVAGGSQEGLVADLDGEAWDRLYRSNLRSTALSCRLALRTMIPARSGAIVTMSSISGLRGDPGWSSYNAMKAAIINLTQSLAWETGRYGIRVNAICPGPIATPRMLGSLEDKAIAAAYDRATAIGRMGRAEEVAAAMAFLASSEASFITGTCLVIDGGLTARTGQPVGFDAMLDKI
jgi:NAD(P)-dependent dehydrogenase (short-subunit alcohol dehydrogenase family)